MIMFVRFEINYFISNRGAIIKCFHLSLRSKSKLFYEEGEKKKLWMIIPHIIV